MTFLSHIWHKFSKAYGLLADNISSIKGQGNSHCVDIAAPHVEWQLKNPWLIAEIEVKYYENSTHPCMEHNKQSAVGLDKRVIKEEIIW